MGGQLFSFEDRMYDEPLVLTHEILASTLDVLPNNHGLWYKEIRDEWTKVLKINPGTIEKLNANLAWFHVVTMLDRPGACEFAQHLEFTHYAPHTPANDNFHYRVLKWEDLLWAIISVPRADANNAYVAASIHQLRLVNAPPRVFKMGLATGVAACSRAITDDDHVFPLNNRHTFSLEGESTGRGPVPVMMGRVREAPPDLPKDNLLDLILKRRKRGRD